MKRLYRLLLRMYPVGFREEYGSELERQFRDEYGEAGSRGERIRIVFHALLDILVTAPEEALRELSMDLRYAVRMYRQRTLATGLALASLAFAIGTTTGIFSVLNALLIRSLPFRDPARLVELQSIPTRGPGDRAAREWLQQARYLEDMARVSPQPMNLDLGSRSFRVTVSETTANFLKLMGVEPDFGRGFAADEDQPDHNPVAVISYGLWQQAFGGDARALGAGIRLNGAPLTVVGVEPPGFDFPEKSSIWTPTAYSHLPSTYFVPRFVGRLRSGIAFSQATALYRQDLERANLAERNLAGELPRLVRLQDSLAGPVRSASLVLMGMMAFVLLIACANLAHLLLSRATERRQELAIRAALGASRGRLTRQLITEATVLTGAAAVAGMAVARWTAQFAAAAQPSQLAARPYSVLDWRVLVFALAVASITGVVFGVLPASLIGRWQPDTVRTRPGTNRASTGRARAVLIALQAALTVTLAGGAFGMGRSFLNLMGTDLGYRTIRVVTMNISVPSTTNLTAPFVDKALDRLRAVPGVESAGAASYLPLVPTKIQEATFYRLEKNEPRRSARVIAVSPDFFRTMGIGLVEGREFTAADKRRADPVVVVTEEFVRQYGGRRLSGTKIYLQPARVWATIVGVVRSQRFLGPESDPWEVIYRPMDQYEQWFATFVAKVHGNPERYLALCRDVVQDVDRAVPVFDVKTLEQRLADAIARPRFYTAAIVFLTAFALLAAAVGAYGAASHSVSQRRHEIGIRIAVGGPPQAVRGMVFRQSMTPVVAGALCGLAGAVGMGRFLKNLLASAEPAGIGMSLAAALVIALATACAVWSGTSRVARTDPAAALKVE